MPDLPALAANYTAAITAELEKVDAMAREVALGIGEDGEPQAIADTQATMAMLDRDRLEHIATMALLTLARDQTGTILRGRILGAG